MGDPLTTGGESVLTLAAVSNRVDDLDARHATTARRLAVAAKDVTTLGIAVAIIAVIFGALAFVLGYFIYSDGEQIGRLRDAQSSADASHSRGEAAQRSAACTVIGALRGDLPGNASARADLNNRLAAARTTLHCTP